MRRDRGGLTQADNTRSILDPLPVTGQSIRITDNWKGFTIFENILCEVFLIFVIFKDKVMFSTLKARPRIYEQ